MKLEGLPVSRNAIRTFVANLSYYSIASDSLSALSCRACRSPLDIHQPNPNQPEQFLGTCSDCGRWYRLESAVQGGEVTVLQLPDVSEAKPPVATTDHHL